jgi:hypothetical protein
LLLDAGNIQSVDGKHFLSVKTQKTGAQMMIKLPEYATDEANMLQARGTKPYSQTYHSIETVEKKIRMIAELAGWTDIIGKVRERQG